MRLLPFPSPSLRPPAHPLRSAHRIACIAFSLLGLAACGERGILDPVPPTASGAHAPRSAPVLAGVLVTPEYSLFDARTDFNAAGVADHVNDFEAFTGAPVYLQPTPWNSAGVTYTSGTNAILGPGAGVNLASNAITADFGSAVTGQFSASDAFTLFGADLSLILSKVAVDIVLYTNLGSYAFNGIDVPLAATGRRFFGVALARDGEYLTGFRVTPRGTSSGAMLDNVAVGHVGVPNAAPDASIGGPYAGDEGAPLSLSFGATDADDDALTFAWDLGDGTTGSGPTPPLAHTYADNGSYDVMLAVADGRGGVDTARTTATIANVAPAVAAFALPAAPFALTSAGVTVPIATSYADPGTLDTHVATLDCGGGVTGPFDAPNGAAAGACTFSSAGVYSVRVIVADDDGGADSTAATGQLVVYDPSAGWVTGGGWIASPVGANQLAPTAGGKLTFGFIARYAREASTPTGNAEFKMASGDFDFRSSALDWLVVDGNVARCEGRGALNGVDGFGFALTVVDAAPGDAMRLRVWNLATGATVYDNHPGETLESGAVSMLGGGSIQIHEQ